MAYEGLLDEAATLLEQLAALLRRLEADRAQAEAAATYEQQRQESDDPLIGINTIPEVARYARVSVATVKRAISNGDLDVLRAGRRVRIRDEAVFQWLRGRERD